MRERPSPIGEPDERDLLPLDDEHVLEPVEDPSTACEGNDPVVRDARGGLWRVRPRPRRGDLVFWAAIGLVVVVLVIAAAMWLVH